MVMEVQGRRDRGAWPSGPSCGHAGSGASGPPSRCVRRCRSATGLPGQCTAPRQVCATQVSVGGQHRPPRAVRCVQAASDTKTEGRSDGRFVPNAVPSGALPCGGHSLLVTASRSGGAMPGPGGAGLAGGLAGGLPQARGRPSTALPGGVVQGGGLLRPDLGSQPGSATSAGRASVSPTGKAWSVDRPLPRGVWGTRACSVTTASAGQHNAQQRTWLSLPLSRVGGRKGHALDPHDLVPVAADTAQRLETWEGVPPRGASPGGPSDTVTSSWTPESGKVDVVSQALVPRRC